MLTFTFQLSDRNQRTDGFKEFFLGVISFLEIVGCASILTRPSVMEVSPQTFGLSKSILLIDHRIAGDHQIAGIDSLNLV